MNISDKSIYSLIEKELISIGQCQLCKKEVEIPYQCTFCGQYFCEEHLLPENHLCPGTPKRDWTNYKKLKNAREGYGWNTNKKPIISHEHFYDNDPAKYPWNQTKNRNSEKSSFIGKTIILMVILGGLVIILHEFDVIDLFRIITSAKKYLNSISTQL